MNQEAIQYTIRELFRIARNDSQYAELCKDYDQLEDAFGKLVGQMSNEEQDTAWGFICVSDSMNWRMLEIICEKFQINAYE